MKDTITNLKGQMVCKKCGHPEKCHANGFCVEAGKPCPCYPDLKEESK